MQQHLPFTYDVYENAAALPEADALLLEKARAACTHAYAPYSQFKVGAAALLADGRFVTGTNQENAAFPVGICAERTLLAAVAAAAPATEQIITMAISYQKAGDENHHPISPCGMCRQALAEWQVRQKAPIRLILAGQTGPVYTIANSASLLPLAFEGGFLKD
jgi:cytidine deaminase